MEKEKPGTKPEAPENDAPEKPESDATDQTPWIVGIGSSAGGLEAISILVQNLPQKANTIYVIAQHMSPKHTSIMTALLARETNLPVEDLHQITKPKPDTIYVTPPNTDVVLENGEFILRKPSGHPASPKPSADRLFKSLAEECTERSVCIVLSGTGSDGSYGVQAVREAGGITIAQEPASAKYDGMPTSAIETGCIDLTLSPDQIGQHLTKILANPRDLSALRPLMDHPNRLSELFGILLARTQVDFADYKENTLNRRIARRMAALNINDYDNYVDYCRANILEVDALHKDLLISVTRFFRDPDQFEHLRSELATALDAKASGPIRVWIVGCATGEEAYSIAIAIAELLGGMSALTQNKIQLFASDIDQNAIEVARRGLYPISAAQDIPPSYLEKYFTVGEADMRVCQELRSTILFSRHNVFQDPPFINIDLISIRNVMIYFNLSLQERVLSRLHYAMAGGGLLFLGTSESVGEMGVYFEARKGADKVYGKRRGSKGELKINPSTRISHAHKAKATRKRASTNAEMVIQADKSLARSVAPNGMICTANGNIIEVLGDLSPFVEIRAGATTSLSVKMLIEPLRTEASSLIALALRNDERRYGRWHTVSLPSGNRAQLQAYPFFNQQGGEMHCLVGISTKFEEVPEISLSDITDSDQRAYLKRMEAEVRTTQDTLQQTIEELQTTNEELQSSNEELQSTNEEFQATNEEMETSNEELQSTNEELLTVNDELQVSSAERLTLASELEATMGSAPYAVALADEALMIRRLSNVALDFFGLKELPPSGIHLSQCNLPPGFPALAPIANSVLRLREVRRLPILSQGKYLTLVMSPVRDVHNKLIGLSITVTQFNNPMARIIDMIGEATKIAHWTYNLDSDEMYWSAEMSQIFGRKENTQVPSWSEMFELTHPEDRAKERDAIDEILREGGSHKSEWRIFGRSGQIITVRGTTIAVEGSQGQPSQLVGVIWDTAEQSTREMMLSNLEFVQDDLHIGFFSFDVENNQPTWNPPMFDILGYDQRHHVPSVESLLKVIHEKDRARATQKFQSALVHGKSFRFKARLVMADGTIKECASTGQARRKENGGVTHVFGSLRDVNEILDGDA